MNTVGTVCPLGLAGSVYVSRTAIKAAATMAAVGVSRASFCNRPVSSSKSNRSSSSSSSRLLASRPFSCRPPTQRRLVYRPLSTSGRFFSTTSARMASSSTMQALVYTGAGQVGLETRPKPQLASPTDAIVRVTKTTICGTDLHIRKGDVATCTPGRILGHEGVGVIDSVGTSVTGFRPGDRVLISCVCSCSACEYCRRGMYSHCTTGGWILGNTIDGTQAQFVRIPHADSSLYALPADIDEGALVMLSDIFPTGFECGVQNARVAPGSTVALVGAGPVGLAALITAQLYAPSLIIAIDMDPHRLEVAKAFGAHHTINNAAGSDQAVQEVLELTGGVGCDAVLEAVGVPASFELCQRLLAPGGTLANVGVHGGPAPLHLEALWDRNVSITTRLVDTVTMPMLLKLVRSGRLDPAQLITHTFRFADMEKAYATFSAAAEHDALKVIVEVD